MIGIGALAKRLFGTANERKIKKMLERVEAINALEAEYEALDDYSMQKLTAEWRDEVEAGKPLDELLAPAFALVREAAKRSLRQRHYDVQLIGGMVLHEGKIAEMKTGEGKTLVATLAVYLNALANKGVHVVTVNDYLARRDAQWMGQVYNHLGLSVDCVVHDRTDNQRRTAYNCDVTYGTNNELGFDYLRDNMKHTLGDMVQRGHSFAIVDEVDSILIDEARTPLIISGPLEDQSELYLTMNKLIAKMTPEDYELDEEARSISLTEQGNEHIEILLREAGLLQGKSYYDSENVTNVHHVNQALRAHTLFHRDKDYIVQDGQVVIIDEFTGRMMAGRRYSEGQHQALEAKENCSIQPESQTLASITFQNYFRLYGKLAGMTGTAATEAEEFMDTYGLDVISIPTHESMVRADEDDEIYRTAAEKYNAIVELVKDCRDRSQPVLVGTTSIEKSEFLASMLEKIKIPHNVLNARSHAQEAQIIAQAGVPGTVTIATNMAGRGTDIQLGGNLERRIEQALEAQEKKPVNGGANASANGGANAGPKKADKGKNGNGRSQELDPEARKRIIKEISSDVEQKKQQVLAAGGLYVIGTERHESRRIDNQLRGRSGRQGDPGCSKFFLSLDDDLMRIFGTDRMDGMLQKLGLQDGEAIIHPWINKALEKAQQKVEARNFDIRKNLLKFDDVMNDQRKAIFEQRIELMRDKNVQNTVTDIRHEVIDDMVAAHIPKKTYADQWDMEGLQARVLEILNIKAPIAEWAREEGIGSEEIHERLYKAGDHYMAAKAADLSPEIMRRVEKAVLLQVLDNQWRDHLQMLEHLRQVIGLRGYGQRDPLNEYKTESFGLFESMLERLREMVTQHLMQVVVSAEKPPAPEDQQLPEMAAHHINPDTGWDEMADGEAAMVRQASWGKVPRNAPCPCGSGKKYKHCHGRLS